VTLVKCQTVVRDNGSTHSNAVKTIGSGIGVAATISVQNWILTM
jgi:hypothetical protein